MGSLTTDDCSGHGRVRKPGSTANGCVPWLTDREVNVVCGVIVASYLPFQEKERLCATIRLIEEREVTMMRSLREVNEAEDALVEAVREARAHASQGLPDDVSTALRVSVAAFRYVDALGVSSDPPTGEQS